MSPWALGGFLGVMALVMIGGAVYGYLSRPSANEQQTQAPDGGTTQGGHDPGTDDPNDPDKG
jgi:hypothetical protein